MKRPEGDEEAGGHLSPPCGKDKEAISVSENKTIYLAYGSNFYLEQLAVRCPTARVVGSTKQKG